MLIFEIVNIFLVFIVVVYWGFRRSFSGGVFVKMGVIIGVLNILLVIGEFSIDLVVVFIINREGFFIVELGGNSEIGVFFLVFIIFKFLLGVFFCFLFFFNLVFFLRCMFRFFFVNEFMFC